MTLYRVDVTGKLIENVLRTGGSLKSAVCVDGLPPDAEIVDAYYNRFRGVVELFFRTRDGENLHWLKPKFKSMETEDGK